MYLATYKQTDDEKFNLRINQTSLKVICKDVVASNQKIDLKAKQMIISVKLVMFYQFCILVIRM